MPQKRRNIDRRAARASWSQKKANDCNKNNSYETRTFMPRSNTTLYVHVGSIYRAATAMRIKTPYR